MPGNSKAVLVFTYPFDHEAQIDTEERGYLGNTHVSVNGHRYPVIFYSPDRLRHDLEIQTEEEGRPFIADPGMIIIPKVTLEFMQAAVDKLSQEDFFDYFKEETIT